METKIIIEKQDLTYLRWSHGRNSSGTAGTFLKSESIIDGAKRYYKLSNFDPINGIIGHECVNELIVDRLLTVLGINHIHYQLINADIDINDKTYNTYLCVSEDYKNPGESKTALDNYYTANSNPGESPYDFCIRQGWQDYVDKMIAIDYIILNRDRHGANIEVLRNSKAHTLRLSPLFDHGLSLLYSCLTDKEAEVFDITEDKRCQNFIGGYSCYENLSLIKNKKDLFSNTLKTSDKSIIMKDIDHILSPVFTDKIWDLIFTRWNTLRSICHPKR